MDAADGCRSYWGGRGEQLDPGLLLLTLPSPSARTTLALLYLKSRLEQVGEAEGRRRKAPQ